MKNKDLNLNLSNISTQFKQLFGKLNVYRIFIFFLFVALTYGYILWRINVLSNAPADTSEEAAQASAQPHIDQATIEKIQNLQDHSVSVQTVFEQARQNPFNE